MESNLIKVWYQLQDMISVRNQLFITGFPLSFDLANDECRISINFKNFDSQINGCFYPKNTSFIFCHVVGTIETDSGGEGNMKTCRRSYNCPYSVPYCVGCSIKHKRPSGSWLGSFLWSRNVAFSNKHDIFVWEIKPHRLIVFHRLVGEIL